VAAEINGHPVAELGNGMLVTVCASCGKLRTILFLDRDRWLCTACRAEGKTKPSLYPVA